MIEKILTTDDVCKRLGTTATTLGSYLSRHPHLKPARRAGYSWLWTEQEYEQLVTFRMRPISRGKKKQT